MPAIEPTRRSSLQRRRRWLWRAELHEGGRLLLLAGLLLPALAIPARADFEHPAPGEVELRDLPGSRAQWQEAHALIDAPLDAVHRWLTEYEYWPGRFKDITATRVLQRRGDFVMVRIRSRLMGRWLVLSARTSPSAILYEAQDGNVSAAGRIFVSATGDGRTDVIMQSTARLGGLLRALAPAGLVRSRQREKLSADLVDLHRLARLRRTQTASRAR